MFLKVIIVGTILGTVVSKFDEPKIIDELTKNHKKCEDTKQWLLVDNYYNRGFNTFFNSSVSVLLNPESLELYVHVKATSEAKLLLILSSKDHESSKSYVYNGSRQESEIGCGKLVFPVPYTGFIYINLLGYSDDSENILIRSFYYEPTIYKIKQDNGDQAVILYIGHEISKAGGTNKEDTKNIEKGIIKISRNEGETSHIGDIRDDTETDINKQEDGDRLLGTWVIVLIVVAAVTVISLIAVGAYHLGVSKGLAKNPTYIEDVEPARVVTIPRVRGVTDSPIGEFM